MPDTESKSPSRFTLEIVLHAAGATCLMYYVGIVNLDRCPAEPMIPIFMIGEIEFQSNQPAVWIRYTC